MLNEFKHLRKKIYKNTPKKRESTLRADGLYHTRALVVTQGPVPHLGPDPQTPPGPVPIQLINKDVFCTFAG